MIKLPEAESEQWSFPEGRVWLKNRPDITAELKTSGGIIVPGSGFVSEGQNKTRICEVIGAGMYTTHSGVPLYDEGWVVKGELVQVKGHDQFCDSHGAAAFFTYSENVMAVKRDGSWKALPGYAIMTDANVEEACSPGGLVIPVCQDNNKNVRHGKIVSVGDYRHKRSGVKFSKAPKEGDIASYNESELFPIPDDQYKKTIEMQTGISRWYTPVKEPALSS